MTRSRATRAPGRACGCVMCGVNRQSISDPTLSNSLSERHTPDTHVLSTTRTSIMPLQITANMTTTTTVRLTPSCETNTRLLCVTTFVHATPRLHQSTRRYFTRWSCCCRKFLLKAFTANAAGAHSAPSGISVPTAPKPAQDRRRHVNCSGSARIVCKAY